MEQRTITGQQHPDLIRQNVMNQNVNAIAPSNQTKYPISVSLPIKQWDNVKNFRPFLESATPDEKLNLLNKTLFKPRKRLKKLMDKRDELVATKLS